jgi:response regulator of citrate/malate metabolism
MDLPVELVGLLKHIGIDGKKLTWDLQVNSSAASVKLMWIKAAKPVEKTGEITNRVQKKKQLSPSTRRRNAQHMDQWKAKREAVGDNTTCVQTQTDDLYPSTDETTQTEQLNSDAQAINIPTVLTKKKGSDRHRQDAHILVVCNQHKKTLILKIPAKNGKAVQLYEVRTTE